MTIDEIVTLIQAVSDNGLTSFVYEEGDQKLVLKKKKKKKTKTKKKKKKREGEKKKEGEKIYEQNIP